MRIITIITTIIIIKLNSKIAIGQECIGEQHPWGNSLREGIYRPGYQGGNTKLAKIPDIILY